MSMYMRVRRSGFIAVKFVSGSSDPGSNPGLRHFTLTVALSTQVYKSSLQILPLHAKETGISSGLMSYMEAGVQLRNENHTLSFITHLVANNQYVGLSLQFLHRRCIAITCQILSGGRGFDSHRGQKSFFFASCGSLIPFTRANLGYSWV